MVDLPEGNLPNPSRFLASTSPRCGSCARTLCVLRDTASCDFASQSSSRCSSGNLTPSVQAYLPPKASLSSAHSSHNKILVIQEVLHQITLHAVIPLVPPVIREDDIPRSKVRFELADPILLRYARRLPKCVELQSRPTALLQDFGNVLPTFDGCVLFPKDNRRSPTLGKFFAAEPRRP